MDLVRKHIGVCELDLPELDVVAEDIVEDVAQLLVDERHARQAVAAAKRKKERRKNRNMVKINKKSAAYQLGNTSSHTITEIKQR